MCPVFNKRPVAELKDVRVAPIEAVVTSKVRIINEFISTRTARGTKGGLNRNTLTQDVPRCVCVEALPKPLAEIVRL